MRRHSILSLLVGSVILNEPNFYADETPGLRSAAANMVESSQAGASLAEEMAYEADTFRDDSAMPHELVHVQARYVHSLVYERRNVCDVRSFFLLWPCSTCSNFSSAFAIVLRYNEY